MKRSFPIVLVLTATVWFTRGWAAVVTTANDTGPGSLREAITNAIAGETITFAVSGAITLSSGELLIAKDLTIAGPGATQLTVQRGSTAGIPDFRIFNIKGGTVSVSGLTVNNGRSDSGGGILNQAGARLALRDVVIRGNSATDAGGGIKNSGTLSLESALVTDNSAGGGAAGVNGLGGGLDNDSTVTASEVRIEENFAAGGANANGIGGGMNNSGTLTLSDCTVNGNLAEGGATGGSGLGGGINNSGTTTLSNCTVRANSAVGGAGAAGGAGGPAEGGGIANADGGTVNVDKSTISGNRAGGGPSRGGGIANECGTVTLENSTVSGNSSAAGPGDSTSPAVGGGLFNTCGTTTLNHSTVTANAAGQGNMQEGCGIFGGGGTVELKNTIVAGNTNSFDLFTVESSIIASAGFNLIGSTNAPVSPGTNDQFNVTGAQLKLTPLQDNGGPTFTHAPLCGSPAIDAGDNTDAPETDQRGFVRIFRGVIDIGACEDSNTAPTVLCPAPVSFDTHASRPVAATVSVQVADADGDELVVIWSMDGTAVQTNLVAGSSTPASVSFTASFGVGSHPISLGVTDTYQCEAPCSTTITIVTTNTGPVALNDSYSVNEDETLAVPPGGVLSNDTDPEGDTLTAELVSGPTHAASFTLNSNGGFSYTPATNYFGPDSFTYRASDGLTNSAPATVSLSVTPVNDSPVAVDDSYRLLRDTTLVVPVSGVLTNDTDADGDVLTAALVSGPTHAAAFTLNPDGSFNYTPAPNYIGPDSFSYRANDGQTNSAAATVSLSIVATNTGPVALNDSYNVNEDSTLTVPASGVLSNDTDLDGDRLTAVLVSGPAHAAAFTLNSDGSFSYTPAPNYFGPDNFTYRANDGLTNSAPATVSLNVMPVNDAPVAVNDSYRLFRNTTLAVPAGGVLSNDSDADRDTLTALLVSGPAHAAAFGLNPDGSFSYTPAPDYVGPDSFSYRANDGQTNSAPATVSLAIVATNIGPVALNDSYSVNQDATLAVPAGGVLSNDSDADGDALTALLVSGPAHAAAFALNPDGSFTYMPVPNYVGPDTFSYRANDGLANSAPAMVSLNVTPVNTPPTIICPDPITLECRPRGKDGCRDNKKDDCRDNKKDDCRDNKKDDHRNDKKDDCRDNKKDDHQDDKKDDCRDNKKDDCRNDKKEDHHDNKREDHHDKEDHCPPPPLDCEPPIATLSVNVKDSDGDGLLLVWTVDGTAYQTNRVAAGSPPTIARVDFTAAFGLGAHEITVSVSDANGGVATCSTTVLVTQARVEGCDLYPIALHEKSLAGVPVGGVIQDIYNGVRPGNFGWLTWAGNPSEPTLVKSLTPPGNSRTYINPNDRHDHVVSVGDWVQGKPGVSNSRQVRDALDTLEQIDITVPVWDQARGKGNNSLYRVVAFARVRLLNYQLPHQNRITARFLGFVSCQ